MARKNLTTLDAIRRELYAHDDLLVVHGDRLRRHDDVIREG